jgi:hypothetical protein
MNWTILMKSILTALGLAVALAFSVPMFATTSANAATATQPQSYTHAAKHTKKKHTKKHHAKHTQHTKKQTTAM